MTMNIGTLDQIVRIFVGLGLLAFAFRDGWPITGTNWLGLLGLVPLLTAFFGFCPLYALFGISSRREET